MKNDDLIPISEAAKLLKVSIMTLRRWDESGRLSSIKRQPNKHRYYRKEDIDIFLNDLFKLAYKWVVHQTKFPEEFYCQNSAIFQAFLVKMQNSMMQKNDLGDLLSLIVSIAGEIGNNSFDHNLGQWSDMPGIFFGYDLNKRQIVLADRGLGILETLKRVKPELKDHEQALLIAFTEIISGRAPENRGNGLKYVRKVISENPINLFFQSGNAVLKMEGQNQELKITRGEANFHGCLVSITF
ncbi:helix-turn-helix domain-containing protein [Patescibacteria group bacterium]|nr:helix-turn-helix domain-containing protein [Patescibacteria group bacterium]